PSMPWTPGVATLASACLSPFVETQEGFPPAVVRPRQWPHDAHGVCAAAYYTSSRLEREQSLPAPIDLTPAIPNRDHSASGFIRSLEIHAQACSASGVTGPSLPGSAARGATPPPPGISRQRALPLPAITVSPPGAQRRPGRRGRS